MVAGRLQWLIVMVVAFFFFFSGDELCEREREIEYDREQERLRE